MQVRSYFRCCDFFRSLSNMSNNRSQELFLEKCYIIPTLCNKDDLKVKLISEIKTLARWELSVTSF